SFTNEEFEISRFTVNNRRFRKAKIGAYKVMSITSSSVYMLMRFFTLVVLVFGAWLTFNNQMKIGELVSFILFVNILQKPIDKIS
ncbi:hypothetical protein KQI01_22080, partial [Vibrio cholerae]|nr:hypothetical protein [Vibrio cholerae]